MRDRIRKLIAERKVVAVDVDTLSDTSDLYEAGLSSFASIQFMLALEDEFDIEFPERMLTRKTFASIEAIDRSIAELIGEQV
ncbi:Phosphopantetheine attachment site [Kaistia soli DSM 19436]|uniref:Phosphopantetheine attachment site n=1 Tax=Kaistia soli DSM 19436 TaxID=1122133 RepID=A0A1M4XLQ2_9HYPH|nr:acyl carrier protein [Kaistia soli]SHE94346.1 Phosphopantetheine attachment site [Kaistia soli DSM 19436]